MVRYHVLVRGAVQGVGFRYFAKGTAERLSLTGWVRNLDSGEVEIEVQGPRDAADAFLAAVRQGSHFSSVDGVAVRETGLADECDFGITG